jgi:hypothetical protein
MNTSLLEAFQMYGQYLQQKGRAQGAAYLQSIHADPAVAAAIVASFNDAGKIIDKNGKTPGLMQLMGMKNFI